ncbi:MAG TPA: hypothetical protein VGG33_02165 [Polyangia bacterium]
MAEPTSGSAGRGRFGPASWFGLVCLVTYAYFLPAPASNEISRFNLVRAVVEHGRLEVDPFAETTADIAQHGGHVYSDKAPGASFLAVPAYAVYLAVLNAKGAPGPAFTRESLMRKLAPGAEDRLFLSPAFRLGVYVCNLFTNVVAGAALATLLLWLLLGWGVGQARALFAAVAFAWGSQNFAYSVMFFGHVLAALGLFGGFVLLERAETARFRDPARAVGATTVMAVAAGFFVGLAVLVELPAALGAAVLVGYAATAPASQSGASPRVRRVLAFVAGMVPGLAALLIYQAAVFGSPFSPGYAHVTDPTFAAGMSQGLLGVGAPRPEALWGMFFGRQRGLFYLAPVLLLSLVGMGQGLAVAKTRRPAVVAAAVLGAFVLMNAGYYMWWGGAALGPRHLVPAMPFVALGFAWLRPPANPAWHRPLTALAMALLVVSVVNVMAAVAVSPLVPWGQDTLADHVYPNLWAGRVALYPGSSNVGMMLGLKGITSLVPLLLIAGLGMWLVVTELRARAGAVRATGGGGIGGTRIPN